MKPCAMPGCGVRRPSGFSLPELLIVMVVVAVLASIAVPSYRSYMLRAYRADARLVMLEAAQWLERHYTMSQSYSLSTQGTAIDSTALTTAGLGKAPKGSSGSNVRYNISFSAGPTATGYTLQAVPTGAQAADTRCGTLTLTNLQVRGVSGTDSVEQCWTR
ncbi:MAG: type IV pilin protein [Rubrivivax sp.]